MYIAIDMGGTNTRIAYTENFRDILAIEKYPTPQTIEEITSNFQKFIKPENLKGIILGTAGQINRNQKQIVFSPHIKSINTKNLSDLLPQTQNTKAFIENDASLAGLAESHQPYAQNYQRVAYITISTGVGGTLIINKSLQNTILNQGIT